MAGDWIKIEHALPGKPEVMSMAAELGISDMEVVGHLVCFWIWVDQNLSRECHAVRVTEKSIDRIAGINGFAKAMVSVGWLAIDNDVLEIPNYDDHLSKTSKARILALKRKRKERSENPEVSQECHARSVTKTGLEKREESIEKEIIEEDSAKAESCGETGETPAQPPPVLTEFVFQCEGKGGKTWTLPRSKLDEYLACYPHLDVRAEIRKSLQWIRDNPTKRKTVGGMPAFLTRWLNNAQNDGGNRVGIRPGRPGPQIGPGQSFDPSTADTEGTF